MTMHEYHKADAARREVIRANASRRMRKLPTLAVPPKPERPTVLVCYDAEGTYMGTIQNADEAPDGSIVKREPAA